MKAKNHISNKSGFKVPKSYFENFEINSLKNEKQKHKSGFLVPDDYFDDFEVKLPKQSKVLKLSDFQKTFAAAAMLIVLLGTLLWGLLIKPQPQQPLNFSRFNQSDLENYLEDEILMDNDMYVEDDNLKFDFSKKNIQQNNIIDDMDDSSIEQLIDY